MPCQLFGSCCVGLAVSESDVDVVVSELAAQHYCSYLSSPSERASALLSYLHSYLSNFQCVAGLKLIAHASIPVVKFSIDTSASLDCNFMRPELLASLNRQVAHAGPVSFDLTVGSSELGCRHLGIVSTLQMRSWLAEVGTLQQVCIILKKSLACRQLN